MCTPSILKNKPPSHSGETGEKLMNSSKRLSLQQLGLQLVYLHKTPSLLPVGPVKKAFSMTDTQSLLHSPLFFPRESKWCVVLKTGRFFPLVKT